jgi:hypothetical protein
MENFIIKEEAATSSLSFTSIQSVTLYMLISDREYYPGAALKSIPSGNRVWDLLNRF